MTTDQLIASCAEAGVSVSVTQLARWVREGLIPVHLRRRRSRGRGRGIEWVWDAECVPRAIIIRQALAQGDPSLKTAAVALAGVGYSPSPERLREVLVGGVQWVEHSFQRRQTYLEQPRKIAARRHVANLRRKTHDLPEPFVDSLATLGLAVYGLDAQDGGAGQYVSFAAFRRALEQSNEAALLAAYEDAGLLLPAILPGVLPVVNLTLILAEGRRAGHHQYKLFNVETIMEDIRVEPGRVVVPVESPARLFRLAFTVVLVAVRVYGAPMIEAVSKPLTAFAQMFGAYAQMSGYSGHSALSHLMGLAQVASPIPKQEDHPDS